MHSLVSSPRKALPGRASMLPDIDPRSIREGRPATRKARIQDVDGMSCLINEFASAKIMLARGPLYLYQNVQDYRVMTVPSDDGEAVVACGGLHVLWEDLAEVRSVAVHPALQRKGLGRAMVEDLVKDARELGAAHVFTFTLSPLFFSSLGFKPVDRATLSPVVWAECSKCPKFYNCDEVSMMLDF